MVRGALNFVTEKELEEKRQQGGGDVEEKPYDPRALWEKLKEAKDKKAAEWEAEHTYNGPVGIDEDEAEFLEDVEKYKVKQQRATQRAIENEVAAFHEAQARKGTEVVIASSGGQQARQREARADGGGRSPEKDGQAATSSTRAPNVADSTGTSGDLLGVKRARTSVIVSSVVTITAESSRGEGDGEGKKKRKKKKRKRDTETSGKSSNSATTEGGALTSLAVYSDSSA